MIFKDVDEALMAYANKDIAIHAKIKIRMEKEIDGVLHVTTADAPQYRVVDMMDYETEKPTFWSVIKE